MVSRSVKERNPRSAEPESSLQCAQDPSAVFCRERVEPNPQTNSVSLDFRSGPVPVNFPVKILCTSTFHTVLVACLPTHAP